MLVASFMVLAAVSVQGAGTATRLIWTTQPARATNGFIFGQSPVLKTADVGGNFSTIGLPAVKIIQVGLYSGSGELSGTLTANIGTTGGNGVITLTNLAISAAGAAQLIAYDIGAGYTPTNISAAASCQLWLDAADLNTLNLTGTTVLSWQDKSGKNNSATGGTSPSLATDSTLAQTPSGLSQTVHFDGVSTHLGVNLSSLSGSPYTIICMEVGTSKSGGSSYIIGNTGGNNTDLTLHVGYNTPTEWRWGQYGDDLNYDTTFTFPTPRISTEKITAARAETLYFNSVAVGSRTAAGLLTGSSLVTGTVGAALGGANYQGDIAELIVYNTALSDTDRLNLENYLATKWSNGLASATSASFTVLLTNGLVPLGSVIGIYRELWTNLSTALGDNLAALTNTTYNPNWPGNPVGSFTKVFTNFEAEMNTGLNHYGQRMRTFVVPPTNGNYTFWISSDDTSQLFLSTDETAANKKLIASVPGYNNPREWTKYPSQQSTLIPLQGGCRYYLEAIMEQGSGGDNLAVRWQLPNGQIEEPMNAASAAGTLLMPCKGVDTLPTIYSQTGNITALERSSFTLSVLAANQGPLTYQWQLNGTNLPNAKNPIFSITNASLVTNNGQVYTCILSNSIAAITNTPITLNILRDTNRPVVLAAQNIGAIKVALTFSKPLDPTTATLAGNYAFTNGQSVINATLDATGTLVTLTTPSLINGSNYSVVLNNIRDFDATPNVIATNTTITFTALPFALQDIGSSGTASTNNYVTNGLIVTAAGNDVGGSTDQFNLEYQLRAGNFDVNVRVASLGLSDIWAKAGFMARETLDPASRFAAAMTTPSINGCFFEWRDPAASASSSTGNFPANYPFTWLRLKRLGNVFTGFASYDGQVWNQLGTATIAMSNQIYLGFSLSSHGTNVTTAQFLNEADVIGNAVVGTVINPHEAIGPSSRKTPIVFSEIMYKPAPRPDKRNLEFIELYNSNPYFQDISGYQVTCADLNFTIPANTILSGGAYLVLAAAPADIAAVYGITNVMGPYTGSLKKSESLELIDEHGAVLLTVPYSNLAPWPVAADAAGHSLVLANPTYGEADPRAWDISDVMGGSPGVQEAYRPSPLRNVVINEILPHSENAGVPQFIELYNHSSNVVDISGCILTDDATTNKYVIQSGTTIPAAGFISFTQSQFGFTLNGAGETLYFIKPDGSRVLDAVQFGGQADGVSYGRWPDGANDFYNFVSRTPGTNNSAILIGDIVINELMYDPITENDDDQYLELYNKGTNTINLAGWQFTTGVTFTIPPNTILTPGNYLVVARNVTNLLAKYPNLNSNNTVGNFSGKLSHNGELVTLVTPQTLNGTTPILVAEDEVAYGAGGRWGQWSSGGGSSLELIDPRSNHRLASNWADSDETSKSTWTDIETTGVLDNGQNYDPSIDNAQIGILDTGECLVDNIEVDFNGVNYVTNSTFETGTNGWSFQGCQVRSSLENTGYNSAHSLHIRNSDHVWTGDNSCQVALANTNLQAGQTVTLRFQARWLHGWPEALLRLNGNWLEAAGRLALPVNLGSPGLPNSRYVTNAGPAIYAVTHTPTLPAANQPAVVSAQVHDPNGVQNLTLFYRVDPSPTYTAVAMKDDGTGGDALSGDGVFSATIPGQAVNTLVAFYISATDSNAAATRFPPLLTNNAPVQECLVLFGDGNPGGSFGVYHLWISSTNATRWANLSDLSNEQLDGTFVTGKRVVYNMLARFAGSPYHQNFDTPAGSLCHYKWSFPDDDQFLGATDFNKIHQPGNFAGDDASLQREQLANIFLRALGVPWLNRRYVAVYVNGNRRGVLMEDAQCPGSDVVKEQFPNDTGGYLYKMQPWFEFAPAPSGSTIGFNNNSWCNLESYTTTGGIKKVARYRYNFLSRRTPDSESNFTNVFNLIDAANSSASPNYVSNLESQADMENWMRVFAANHAAGNWDSFGTSTGQNLYGYVGTEGTRYSLLMWDFNLVFGNSGSWAPGENLFTLNGEDPNMSVIYSTPVFLRMYWRALEELINGPMNIANSGPVLIAKYNVFTANGFAVENPQASLEPFVSQARASIASQLASVNAPAFSVNPSVITSNNVAYVSGTAPVDVADIWINGLSFPLNWTSLTGWTITLPLVGGNNTFNIVGVDHNGQPIPGATNTVSLVYNGNLASPVGDIVINEIMIQPVVGGAQFLELYNNSTNVAFDLSGWQLSGLGYTFPTGSLIGPTNFVMLAANRTAFAAAYGNTIPVMDTFIGNLPPAQTLALIQPGNSGGSNTVVTEVKYATQLPWPTNGAATGSSLQLIDSRQDNWRVANWAVKTSSSPFFTPGATNTVAATLPLFPSLWLNEVEPGNLSGITNSAGQHTAWLEIYNPGTNAISLNGLFLANNYTNLLQSAFPSNTTVNAGQFKIIFADGLTNLSTTNEPHTSFVLPSATGSLALIRNLGGQAQVMDYLDYANVPVNSSYGSAPDGQSFVRQLFFNPTPGVANATAAPPPPSSVSYALPGAIYTQNFDSLPNPGASSINSSNPVTINGLTYSLANPFDFAFPVSATGNGGLGIQQLAGWYGLADPTASVGTRFGATDGDQTTGGQISFGSPNDPNRALGLLATSTTGYTAFGLKLVNNTEQTLKYMNLQFTGEVWRQSDTAKTLQFYYFVDPTSTAAFSTAATANVPVLNVNFPTFTADKGGVAVNGNVAPNQTNCAVVNQFINWPPDAALWLVWEMASPTGKAQGLAIDNLNFSATSAPSGPPPGLGVNILSGGRLVLTWPTLLGPTYQIESSTNLSANQWQPVGASFSGTGTAMQQTNLVQSVDQTYYRLKLIP